MKFGFTPFYNPSKAQLLARIKLKPLTFPDRNKYQVAYTDKFMDLVKKLLSKDSALRLGSVNDVDDIISHPFFEEIDIKAVLSGEI